MMLTDYWLIQNRWIEHCPSHCSYLCYFVCISVQETINLLSGGTSVPPGSTLTLARALSLLSDLREGQNTTLLNLLYALLKNEVNAIESKQILHINFFIS